VKLYDERFCPLKDKGPEDIDFVVVRENNEGLYTGSGGFVFKGTPHEIAVQESINTRRGVERCLRFAFEFTRKRNKEKKLTLCGSAPKYAGQCVINPLAAICAGQMMLDFLGETAAAAAIETAVIKSTREKIKSLAAGKMGFTTPQVGDLVAAAV